MQTRPKEEGYEILDVPVTDASADPWTMMIVHFNANTALTAME